MSITLNDPAMPHLTGEKSVSIADLNGTGVHIHPWDRPAEDTNPREVAVVVGSIEAFESKEDRTDEFSMTIVDRDDFIEAIVAVFPELRRA